MQSELKQDNQIHLEFDESTFWNNLRKKRNWSSTGLDKTTNFWIKACKSLLTAFSLTVKNFNAEQVSFSSLVTWRQDSNDSEMQRSKGKRPQTNHLLKHKI